MSRTSLNELKDLSQRPSERAVKKAPVYNGQIAHLEMRIKKLVEIQTKGLEGTDRVTCKDVKIQTSIEKETGEVSELWRTGLASLRSMQKQAEESREKLKGAETASLVDETTSIRQRVREWVFGIAYTRLEKEAAAFLESSWAGFLASIAALNQLQSAERAVTWLACMTVLNSPGEDDTARSGKTQEPGSGVIQGSARKKSTLAGTESNNDSKPESSWGISSHFASQIGNASKIPTISVSQAPDSTLRPSESAIGKPVA